MKNFPEEDADTELGLKDMLVGTNVCEEKHRKKFIWSTANEEGLGRRTFPCPTWVEGIGLHPLA